MAKKTLLQLVQAILNDMDSDQVSSISETVEAGQVAAIVQSCYEEIISNRNWPHLRKIIQLEASNDLLKPNYLRIPDEVKEVVNLKYNNIKDGETAIKYRDITYLEAPDFLDKIYERNSDLANVIEVVDFSDVPLLIMNDKAPEYWTSFDDKWIVCDSYDSTVDDTLMKSKTQSLCYVETEFLQEDSFVPNLPDEAFSLLQEEAKSTAFMALKQMANQKAEMKAARQQRWLSRKAWKAHGGIQYDSYGRKGKK